jgi:hypothetical protein
MKQMKTITFLLLMNYDLYMLPRSLYAYIHEKVATNLSPDDRTSLVLLSLLNNELGMLCFLGSNLFCFNGIGRLFPKAEACDGHIIQCNIEVTGLLSQNLPNLPA